MSKFKVSMEIKLGRDISPYSLEEGLATLAGVILEMNSYGDEWELVIRPSDEGK